MAFFSWSRWFRSLLRPQVKPIRKQAQRLQLEALETRLAPATVTFTWTGQDHNGKWSDPMNWLSNNVHAAPTGQTGNEDLVFPAGAVLTSNNDIASGPGPNGTPVFNSISITGTGYTIGGLAITLGSSTVFSGQTGEILENGGAGATNNIDFTKIYLGGGADSGQQDFSVSALNSLTIGSVLASPSGAPGKGLKDIGSGTLVLTATNTFIEPFTIVGGIVEITNADALGDPTATGSTNATTVDANAQLQLDAPAGSALEISEPLFLNGPGTQNNGALLNVAGNNIWATAATGSPSSVTLGSATSTVLFGVNPGTSLNIEAQINDQGSGVGVEKVGGGQLIFSHVGGNVYRGNTDIENGILTIQDPGALGNGFLINGVPHVSTTTVNDNPVAQTFGTLQLDNEDRTRSGFVVSDEQLILDSDNGTDALDNFKGDNTWTGSVTLGATVNPYGPILIDVNGSAASATNLLISGIVGDPSNATSNGGPFALDKIGGGRLILTNSNTYAGATNIEDGELNVEDSHALGADNKPAINATTVFSGAALELELQTDDLSGVGLGNLNMIPTPALDSRTGLANQMVFEQTLNANGTGINNTGALHSISGINAWEGTINLEGSIGVEPDPNPSNSQLYFPAYNATGHVVSGDYSLTVGESADMVGPVFPAGGAGGTINGNLTKVGAGQLILPQSNGINTTDIQDGWITIDTSDGLGAGAVTVENGAALQLKAAAQTQMTLANTFNISGTGITHPYGMISQMGAIESMDGQNALTGTINLNGVAGIGVEHVPFGGAPVSFGASSQLTISGYVDDMAGTHGGITKLGSDRLIMVGMGTYTGPVDIVDGIFLNQSATGLGAGGAPTSTTTTELGVSTIVTLDLINAVPNSTTFNLTLNGTPVVNPATGNTTFTYTGNAATDTATLQAALAAVVGAGNVTVVSASSTPPGQTTNAIGEYQITFGGALLGKNETLTATKIAGNGTVMAVVEAYGSGTALELANSDPTEYVADQLSNESGGIGSGIGVWGEQLILKGTGDANYGDTAPLDVIAANDPVLGPFADPIFPTDDLWNGPITLANTPTGTTPANVNIYVAANSRITVQGAIGDGGLNDNLTFNGLGQVNLAAPNTYGGMTYVNSGVLTVMNDAALGTPGTSAVQTINVSALTPGSTYTINFNNAPTAATVTYTGNSATDIAALTNALNALPTIGGPAGSDLGGSVNVVENTAGVFTVTLGGSLSGFAQPLMQTTTTGVQITQVTAGTGGTVVNSNAQLQIAGDVTIADEPLLISGNGDSNLASAGPTAPTIPTQWFPVGPAPIANGQTVGNENVGGRITGIAQANGAIYVATSGGGVWKSVDNGNSWRPIFDSIPDLETLAFTPAGNATFTYTLSFTGPDATGKSSTQQTANLTFDPNNLNGDMLAIEQALDGLSNIGGIGGEVTVTQQPGTATPTFLLTFGGVAMAGTNVTGALTASPTGAPPSVAEGQVEAGTEVGSTAASPFSAMYVGAITAVGNTLYVGTGEADNSSDSYYGTGLYKSTDGGVTWSLMVDNIDTTANGAAFNPFYGMAINQIAVDPDSPQDVYVAASNIVGGTPLPNMVTAPLTSQVVGGTPIGGIWRYSTVAGDTGPTWFNMTDNTSSARATLDGQSHPATPDTPGPDDDFRLSFPTAGAVDWTSVAVVDTDVANDGTGFGQFGPVVYGALGEPGGLIETTSGGTFSGNGVYRCQPPTSTTDSPVWYVGDPGKPVDQVEQIVYAYNDGTNTTGQYTMSFGNTSTANNPGLIQYIDNHDQTTIANGLDAGLNILLGFGNYAIDSSTFAVGSATVDVEFTGALADSPEPLLKVVSERPSPGLTITVTVKTAGGGVDTESGGEYNALPNDTSTGVVKLGVVAGATLDTTTVYASATNWTNQNLLGVYVSNTGGLSWAATAAQPTNDQGNEGAYDNSIVVANADTVFVGGMTSNLASGSQLLFGTTDGGGNWVDYTAGLSVGPHTSIHALAMDGGNVLVGTDGGLFELNTNTSAWSDLNGNVLAASLDVASMESVAPSPTNPSVIYGGSASNGLEEFDALPGSAGWQGTPTWEELNDYAGATSVVSASTVLIDPNNPENIYEVQDYLSNFNGEPSEVVLGTSNGGTSWNSLLTLSQSRGGVLVMDPLDTSRLLAGDHGVMESTNQGQSWINLGPFLPFGLTFNPTAIAVASYQGEFVADPRFPDVTDVGANTYVPGTIYTSDGTNVYVTKDHGERWAVSTPGGPGQIINLQVDPRNSNVVYAVYNGFNTTPGASGTNGGQVYMSTDGGQTWNAITDGLPNVRAWSLAIDPRNGNLYLGTDIGVYQLPYGSSQWQRFGTGMPNVEVRSLALNQTTNMLVAGTYGRGTYELFLDAQETAAPSTATSTATPLIGALVALSGQSIWSGPIILGNDGSGSVTLGADGNPSLTNGISTAQLDVHGTISDATLNAPVTIDKIGTGNIVLSGANVYGGLTDIEQGVLIANNPQALGQAGTAANGTVVAAGAALQLESSIGSATSPLEELTLNGDGPAPTLDITNPALAALGVPTVAPEVGFDGHNTGALESIANTNTFFGSITLDTNATIGVASQSVLTITGTIGDGGQGYNLTKELAGTLILDDSNTYSGTTFVNQGALQILNPNALADTPITYVLDGAQLQIASGVNVAGDLSLSGTGIAGTGAMLGVDGTSGQGIGTWSGDITIEANPGFAALTDPLGVVSFGANAGDELRITGTITDDTSSGTPSLNGLRSGLETVGAGTVALAGADTYSGSTYVTKGSTLEVQNPLALGGYANPNSNNSATEEVQDSIQRLTVFDPNYNGTLGSAGNFTLSFGGNVSVPLSVTSSDTAIANAVAGVLKIPAGAVSVTTQTVTTPLAPSTAPTPALTEFVFTIVFDALTLFNANLPIDVGQIIANGVGNVTAVVSTVADGGVGALVENGGTLALELPNNTTVSGVALQLNGTGVGGNGALQDVGASGTTAIWAGPNTTLTPEVPAITLGINSPVGADGIYADGIGGNAGTTLEVVPASGLLPIAGPVNAELAKAGAGTLFLPTANSYAGTTDIQNGIVRIQDPNALGAPSSDELETVTITGSISGTFDLFLDGTQIATGISTNFNNPATLTQLQEELHGLATVTQSATNTNVYTLDFNGTFNGQSLAGQPVDAVTSDNSSVVPAELVHGGLGGTVVENAGTLQLTGGINYNSGEILTLNGPGFNPGTGVLGALESTPQGNTANTWSNPIMLATDSAIGVDPVSPTPPPSSAPPTPPVGLFLTGLISGPAGFDKINQGTLDLTGSVSNTFGGTATVTDGLLELDMSGSAVAIPNALVVGVPAGDLFPTARLLANGQIATNATVTVNTTNGLFDINGFTTQFQELFVNDGTAQTGNGGQLTLGPNANGPVLNMTGGVLNMNTGGIVDLDGNLVATSDPTVSSPAVPAATITSNPNVAGQPTGLFELGSAVTSTSTFTVNFPTTTPPTTQATDLVDLDIQTPITTSAVQQVVKNGAGRMELDANNVGALQTPLLVNNGDVQVDGIVNDVTLASTNGSGASVGGTGTIYTIDGGTAAVPIGAVDPGDNGSSASKTGILNLGNGSNTITWGQDPTSSNFTTLSVNLAHLSAGSQPIAGQDYDQIVVNGTLNLGGSGLANTNGTILTGIIDPTVKQGDKFTILTTTPGSVIIGRFRELNGDETDPSLSDGPGNPYGVEFIDGQKFDVDYVPDGSGIAGHYSSVVLIRAKESVTTFTLTSNLPNGQSVYSQDVVFTGNVVLDGGFGSLPPGDQAQFTVTNSATNAVVATANVPFVNGVATFDPQAINHTALGVGNYTVTMSLLDPTGNINSPGTLTYTSGSTTPGWTINKDNTTITLAPASSTTAFNVPATVTATVTGSAPPNGSAIQGTLAPSGTVNFILDNSTTIPGTLTGSGTVAITLPANLTIGTHTIKAAYIGVDPNYNTSNDNTAITVTVGKDNTLVQVGTTTGNPPTYVGQAVTLTALITNTSAGQPTPQQGDSVQFIDVDNNNQVLGTALVSLDPKTGAYDMATLSVPSFAVGAHNIEAQFLGDASLNENNPAQGNLQFTVSRIPTSVTLSSSTGGLAAQYGAAVTFTATVSTTLGLSAGAGTLTGVVDFYDGNTSHLIGAGTLNSAGQATVETNTLTATGGTSPHTIIAIYTGNTDYTGSQTSGNTNLSQQVEYGDTTTVSVTPSPATYNSSLPLTVTATVTTALNTPPGNAISGTVIFTDMVNGVANPLPSSAGAPNPAPLVNGEAFYPIAALTNQLPIGVNQITATFNDSNTAEPVFITSGGTANEIVLSQTTTTVTSSTNGAAAGFGASVTFFATVAPVSPGGGTPANGTVQFIIDGNTVGTVTLGSDNLGHTYPANVAAFVTSTLALTINKPSHQVSATYSGDGTHYAGSTGSLSGGQAVYNDDSVTLNVSATTTGIGIPVTLTATVSPLNTSSVPTGTVTFEDNGVAIPGATNVNLNASGQTAATPVTFNTLGNQSITAVYNFNLNTGFITNTSAAQTIDVLNTTATTVTVSSAASAQPYVYGQNVTLSATVTDTSGGPAPTGTVTFYSGTTPLGSVTNYPTSTSIQTTQLPVGSDSVTAVYTSNNNLFGSTSAGSPVTVNADGTNIGLSSSDANAVYSEPLTITATILAATPGSGTPTGTVQFTIDNGMPSSPVNVVNGVATYTVPTALTATGSPHTIAAAFTPSGANGSDFKSSNNSLSQTIAADNTNVAVGSSATNGSAVYGQALTLTATVTAQGPGVGIPVGTVQFAIDGTNVGSPANVGANGQATLLLPTQLAVNTYSVTATYTPTLGSVGNFNGNSGTMAGGLTVTADTTTTTVSSSTGFVTGSSTVANAAAFGVPVTFTATVAPSAPGVATPTGNVVFTVDNGGPVSVQLGHDSNGNTAGIPANEALYITSTLSVTLPNTPHDIVASYVNADGNFDDSSNNSSPLQIQIVGAPTTTTLNSPVPSSEIYSAPVTLSATVTVNQIGSASPQGSVTFFATGTSGNPVQLGNPVGLTQIGSSDQFSAGAVVTPLLDVGTYSIEAVYSGDANYAGSTSNTQSLTVTPDKTTTTLLTSDSSAIYSELVTYTAVVKPTSGTAIAPNTTVNFVDVTVASKPVPLGSGTVTFDAANNRYDASISTALAVGTHKIEAEYQGNTDDQSSNNTLSQTISLAPTSITSLTSANGILPFSSYFGQAVTYTATVAADPRATAAPTGSVTFYEKLSSAPASAAATIVGTGTLVGNTATLTYSTLPVGTAHYNITAVYNGLTNEFAKSPSSTALSQTVLSAQTGVALTSPVNIVVLNTAITLTATVTTVPGQGAGTPTGSVQFKVDGLVQGPAETLTNGVAKVAWTPTKFGPHTITMTYNPGTGNLSYAPSSGTATLTAEYADKVSLTTSPTSVLAGQSFTVTATVTAGTAAVTAKEPTPTGSIVFLVNGTAIQSSPITISGSGTTATAVFPITTLVTPGTYTITAQYSGDSIYAPNTATTSQSVYPVPASITAQLASPPTSVGTSFTVTAKLYDSNGNQILQAGGTATISELSGPAGGFAPTAAQATVSFNSKTGMFTFTGLRVTKNTTSTDPYVLEVVYGNLPPATISFQFNGRVS